MLKYLLGLFIGIVLIGGSLLADGGGNSDGLGTLGSIPSAPVKYVYTDTGELKDSIETIIYFTIGFSIAAFLKKYVEHIVGKWVTIYALRRQGKVSDGLHIAFDGYRGVVVDINVNRIKIALDKDSMANKSGKNFLIVKPQKILDGTVEVIVDS